MPRPRKSLAFSGALSLTVALVLLICISPFAKSEKAVFGTIVAAGWIFGGAVWIIQRYGKVGSVAVGGCVAIIAGMLVYAYVRDEPNRQLVERIKELGAKDVKTEGLLTTRIWSITFGLSATDDQVKQFTELEGLEELESLRFDGTKLTDATAERLEHFRELRVLTIDGAKLQNDTILDLNDNLPKCQLIINGKIYFPSILR
jgi:hypothetical protein